MAQKNLSNEFAALGLSLLIIAIFLAVFVAFVTIGH